MIFMISSWLSVRYVCVYVCHYTRRLEIYITYVSVCVYVRMIPCVRHIQVFEVKRAVIRGLFSTG